MEFAKINAGVTTAPRVGLNPYAIGMLLFYYIEEMADKGKLSIEFERIMNAFNNPLFRLMEIGLLGVFLFHGINGLRVFFMDYGPMAKNEVYVKYLLGTFVLVVLVFLAGGLGMLNNILAG